MREHIFQQLQPAHPVEECLAVQLQTYHLRCCHHVKRQHMLRIEGLGLGWLSNTCSAAMPASIS